VNDLLFFFVNLDNQDIFLPNDWRGIPRCDDYANAIALLCYSHHHHRHCFYVLLLHCKIICLSSFWRKTDMHFNEVPHFHPSNNVVYLNIAKFSIAKLIV